MVNRPQATRWLSWYGVSLASADRLPVKVYVPYRVLGWCDLPFIKHLVVKLDYGRCLQSTRAVSILLCSIWDCRSWFEISIYESEWIYMKFRTLCVQCEALFGFMTRSECFQKHSLCSWVGMLWLHRFRKLFDLLEVYESDWDVFGSSISILDMASYIWDVDEACFVATCEYLRYLGIVRTMPTYLIWGTPALWGQCLRTLFEILRYCEDNAYVSSLASGYLIWKSTLWSLHLWPTADVWLLQ